MRYYYKKNNKPAYNLKQPVENYPDIDKTGLVSITESEWNSLTAVDESKVQEYREKADELASLLSWFKHYDEQCIQYARHQRLGIESDIDIESLDAEATTKAARIKELRNE